MEKFCISLSKLENPSLRRHGSCDKSTRMLIYRNSLREFHINKEVRDEYGLEHSLFALSGNVVLADIKKTRELAAKFNAKTDPRYPERYIRAGQLYAMGLIDEIMHYVVALYRRQTAPKVFEECLAQLENKLGETRTKNLFDSFWSLLYLFVFPFTTCYAG